MIYCFFYYKLRSNKEGGRILKNIITINNDKNLKFKLSSIWVEGYEFNNEGEREKVQKAIIVLYNTHTNVSIVHPLSKILLLHTWSTKKYNTQRQYGKSIVGFLNFCESIKYFV